MSRVIEVMLFLSPFIAFGVWRLVVRTVVLPLSFLVGASLLVLAMLGGLLWNRQQHAGDARDQYVPATLQGGAIIPGGPSKGS